MAKGLDIGTSFLVAASKDPSNPEADVQIKSIRDAFLDVEKDQATLNMLKMSNTSYIEEKDTLYIIGEPALSVANLLKREARRPLSKGIISPGEADAEKILVILLKGILGKPAVADEVVYYSIPGAPIDRDIDTVYHERIFKKIIEALGYRAHQLSDSERTTAMNEATAIVYSNCQKDGFTGLATSCLTPGHKVITDKGFVNIENITDGIKVLTKEGNWVSCVSTQRKYKGPVYKINPYGASSFEVTENHQIWVMREGQWSWVEAKEVSEGDYLMQPWDNYNPTVSKRPYICFDERITSSNQTTKKSIKLTDYMAELMGFWFGDGHIERKRGAICITQDNKEIENLERIAYLVKSVFGKYVKIYSHGSNSCRLKFYSTAFANWLSEKCYDGSGNKRIPWKVSELNDSVLRSMLRGLIATDGDFSELKRHVGFTSTSGSLAQFVYLSLQRLGCSPSVHVSGPREGVKEIEDGHIINGEKEVYTVRSSGYEALSFISWYNNPYKTIIKSHTHGNTIVRVSDITTRDYDGIVYDVSIDDDSHSFCLPGVAIHNCGAGMVNTALVYQTMPGMMFSLSNSGDYIDQSAAKAVGTTATRIMSVKERGVDLLDPYKGDPKYEREREAIVVYYRNLIRQVIDGIKKEFKKDQSTIELPDEIPWVISGGTSKAINFIDFFRQEFAKVQDGFPIGISEIRMAEDPLNDVAKGLLVAALND